MGQSARQGIRSKVILIALAIGAFDLPRVAQASPDYPEALAAAIAKQYPAAVKCVPLCTACHLTTQGGPHSINEFGASLESPTIGKLTLGDASAVAPSLARLAAVMPPVDSDGDGVSDIDELIAGDSPSIAGDQGKNRFCSDERFGCGARIAAAPPLGPSSWLALGLAGSGLIVRRRARAALRGSRPRE